jgi:hypothetical protein
MMCDACVVRKGGVDPVQFGMGNNQGTRYKAQNKKLEMNKFREMELKTFSSDVARCDLFWVAGRLILVWCSGWDRRYCTRKGASW